MKKILTNSYYVFILMSFVAHSQIIPAENAKLHYRLIGFSFPAPEKGLQLRLEIAAGKCTSSAAFDKNILLSKTCETNRVVAEVPQFGKDYTWRIAESGRSHKHKSGKLHHFSTLAIPDVDSANVRLRVIKSANRYKDAYVFLDGTRALYDMNGRPVWFIPESIWRVPDGETAIADLKASSQGTITFLRGDQPFEINYRGDVLWKLPTDSAAAAHPGKFHHEFTALKSGNYMSLSNEYVYWKLPSAGSKVASNLTDSAEMFQRIEFGTVKEYNKMGENVWSWQSSKHFQGSDIHNKINSYGKFDADVHLNAFHLDEENHNLYLSFKNINRVLKVRYPDGKVLHSFGRTYQPGQPRPAVDPFCAQHSCRTTSDGHLCLFNNNVCNDYALPRLLIFDQADTSANGLHKIWEYEYSDGDIQAQKTANIKFARGGNIIELPDQSLFASINLPYSVIFIVSRNKEVQWSALPEKWNPSQKKWESLGSYRASITAGRQEIENLVFGK